MASATTQAEIATGIAGTGWFASSYAQPILQVAGRGIAALPGSAVAVGEGTGAASLGGAAAFAAPFIAVGLGLTYLTAGAVRGANKAVQNMQASNVSANDQALVMDAWASGGMPIPIGALNKPPAASDASKAGPQKAADTAMSTVRLTHPDGTTIEMEDDTYVRAHGNAPQGAPQQPQQQPPGPPGRGIWSRIARGIGATWRGIRALCNAPGQAARAIWRLGVGTVKLGAVGALLDYGYDTLIKNEGWGEAAINVWGDVKSTVGNTVWAISHPRDAASLALSSVEGWVTSTDTPSRTPTGGTQSPAHPPQRTLDPGKPRPKYSYNSTAPGSDTLPHTALNTPRNYKADGGIPNPDIQKPVQVAAATPTHAAPKRFPQPGMTA